MSLLQKLSRALFFFVLIGAVLSVRVIFEGQAELIESDRAFNRGDLKPALEHARRSATLYAPGATHVAKAYQRLLAIALGAEAAGDPKLAFLAWQDMRSAALESRHLWLSQASELERANRNLARLESVARGATDRAAQEQQALSSLNDDSAPLPGWLALSGAGFLLTLAGLSVFAFRSLDRAGELSSRSARLAAALVLIGVACWTLAAYEA
jgi:hypothetical protein